MTRECLVLVMVLALWTGMASGGPDYRVAGVVGQENRWLLAIIENPTGECRIYASGDALGQGRIIEVTSHGVVADFSGEQRLLKLEGSAFISGAGTEAGNSAVSADGTDRLLQGRLPPEELNGALTAVAAELEKDGKKDLEPQVLNALLGFPSQARIVSINEVAVKTPREAVKVLKETDALNSGAKIVVSVGGESNNVYLTPKMPGSHPHESLSR